MSEVRKLVTVSVALASAVALAASATVQCAAAQGADPGAPGQRQNKLTPPGVKPPVKPLVKPPVKPPAQAGPRSGSYESAIKFYNKGAFSAVMKTLSAPNTADEFILVGRTFVLLGVGDGTASFVNAARLEGFSPRTRAFIAVGHLDKHDYDAASREANKGLNADPKNIELKSIVGRCTFKNGQTEIGIAAMTKALEKLPKSEICLENLARTYDDSFDPKKAEIYYTRMVDAEPGTVAPLFKRAFLYRESSQEKKFLADLNAILKINPACQFAYYQRALYWQKAKQFEKAIEDSNKALACKDKIDYLERKCTRVKVDSEEHLHRYAEAAEHSKALTKGSSSLVGSYGVRGDFLRQSALLEKTGKYAEALKVLQPLIKSSPNRTEVMVLHARILGKSGQFKESLVLCNKLIALDPQMPDWYRMRARAYNGLGNKAAAAKDLATLKSLGDEIPELPSLYQDK